ncbi:MAG: type II toxin-antitoxin system ParD family antitoxin, partial [Nitrospira sp.]|nr:type II toxin-antitoxin system ParD family antitoxin [Nitrospira sp.]
MVDFDPDTGRSAPEVLKAIVRANQNNAGITAPLFAPVDWPPDKPSVFRSWPKSSERTGCWGHSSCGSIPPALLGLTCGMNITLPSQLRHFVEREIKKGRFENASDVVADGLRLLEMRDQVAARPAITWAILGSMGDGNIEAMAFLVMMEAAKSAREDLKEIMEEMKAINRAKAALRELIKKLAHDMAANRGKAALEFGPGGIGSEKGYHRIPLPHLDPGTPGGVRMVSTDMHP